MESALPLPNPSISFSFLLIAPKPILGWEHYCFPPPWQIDSAKLNPFPTNPFSPLPSGEGVERRRGCAARMARTQMRHRRSTTGVRVPPHNFLPIGRILWYNQNTCDAPRHKRTANLFPSPKGV